MLNPGTKYNGPVHLSQLQHKFVAVNYRDDPLDAFTVIRAKCPEEWADGYFQVFNYHCCRFLVVLT